LQELPTNRLRIAVNGFQFPNFLLDGAIESGRKLVLAEKKRHCLKMGRISRKKFWNTVARRGAGAVFQRGNFIERLFCMLKKFLLGAAALAALSSPAHALTLYAVDEDNQLYSFDSANPGVNLSSVAITGIGGAGILAMDNRVRTGITYLLSDDKKLYSLSLVTGVATLQANLAALTGTNFGFDFNPTNANLRIVSNDNTNYVYNFMTNTLVPGVNVAYGAGPLFGADPDVTGNGYLNNDNNAGTGTVLYALDTRNDVLATQNAATGVLTHVGALGVNLGPRASFEIATRGTTNSPFVLNNGRLFRVNLATGALANIGATDGDLFALTSTIPEPAAWGLMVLGFGAVGGAIRSRRKSGSAMTVTA
jgi:phosphoglycolate phosphatase-like HAD superfamily hydrolase